VEHLFTSHAAEMECSAVRGRGDLLVVKGETAKIAGSGRWVHEEVRKLGPLDQSKIPLCGVQSLITLPAEEISGIRHKAQGIRRKA
jgi:hypothetical protein